MKLTNNLLKSLLLLMLLSNSSSAQESCKGGFCMISLDSLDDGKNLKKVKSSTTTLIKNENIHKEKQKQNSTYKRVD